MTATVVPVARALIMPECTKYANEESAQASLLFIGNSLTFYNELPLVLARMLKCQSPPAVAGGLKIWMMVQGGFTLEDHWRKNLTRTVVTQLGPWDYVVLQEQSIRILSEEAQYMRYLENFVEEVRKCGAKPVLYATWSLENEAAAFVTVTERFCSAAEKFQLLSVPVGRCWERLRKEHPGIQLYQDAVHPTESGTYLAACAFLRTLFATCPIGVTRQIVRDDGSTVFELDEETALILQQTAELVCSKETP